MEDEKDRTLSPDDSAEPTAAGILEAVLSVVLGDRLPTGPLGQDDVPPDALQLPVGLLLDKVVKHHQHCPNRLNCSHMPSSLRRFGSMRPKTLENNKDVRQAIGQVLWTDPEHPEVEKVAKYLLDKGSDIVEEVETTSLIEGYRFDGVFSDNDPILLAGIFWAMKISGRDGPDADILFRIAVYLSTSQDTSPTAEGVKSSGDNPEASKAGQARYDAGLKKGKKETKAVEKILKTAQKSLRKKDKLIGNLQEELESKENQCLKAVADLEPLQERVAKFEKELEKQETAGETAQSVNYGLRKHIRNLQQERRDLDRLQSNLATKLGTAQSANKRLRLELDSHPEDKEMVHAFLNHEETRIQEDRLILSGGDKERADEDWTAHRKLKKAFLGAYPEYVQPPPGLIQDKAELRFVALGGSNEIGRSCYLLELGEYRILVDCGIKPGKDTGNPDLGYLDRQPDALILTHAHTDHIGWVPALVRLFPELDIYCSPGTAALLPVMLEDSWRHYTRRIKMKRDRAEFITNAEAVEEEYDRSDVEAVSHRVVSCEFGVQETLTVDGGKLKVKFFPAGHILGAASVLIEDQTGRRIFMSGDMSSDPQRTLDPASWPEDLGEIDLLVLESTYGDRRRTKSFEENRKELINIIRETTEEGMGSVILASFGLGRAQELIQIIADARNDGNLNGDIPVYVDGMIKRINPIYQAHAKIPFELPESFNEISSNEERRDVARNTAHLRPCIIVTTSGMLSGGPVVEYAQHLLPESQHCIVLTGYQDEGSPTRIAKMTESGRGPRTVRIHSDDGKDIEFKAAQRAKEVNLSAHADQKGLLEYAAKLNPKYIVLVHGDPEAQQALKTELRKTHPVAEIVCGPSELPVP
jgi:Cft2 family RNA processing exonuclease